MPVLHLDSGRVEKSEQPLRDLLPGLSVIRRQDEHYLGDDESMNFDNKMPRLSLFKTRLNCGCLFRNVVQEVA